MREEKKHAEVGKRVRNTRKDQSMAGVINFILTGVHAACMHCMQSACRAVKIELKPGLILMRVPDAPQSAFIIRMFLQSPLTALHASCMHCMQTCQDCVCCLKSKSLQVYFYNFGDCVVHGLRFHKIVGVCMRFKPK